MRLILASSSPRRRAILALLGIPFEVVEPPFEELLSVGAPIEDEVLAFARGKARSVAQPLADAITIGSDTMIGLNGEKFGKPADLDDARRMLRALCGKTHVIFTAVVLIAGRDGKGIEAVEQVEVDMRRASDAEVERYLARGESLDKAGAYSIQGAGAELIEAIRGDYLAAVGMPLKPIANFLASREVSFSFDVERLYREKSFLNWSRF